MNNVRRTASVVSNDPVQLLVIGKEVESYYKITVTQKKTLFQLTKINGRKKKVGFRCFLQDYKRIFMGQTKSGEEPAHLKFCRQANLFHAEYHFSFSSIGLLFPFSSQEFSFCILFRNDSPPPLLNSLVETFSWDMLSQLFSFLRCLRQWNNAIWREIVIKALGEAPHIHTGHQSSKKWNFLFTSFILA